MKNIFISAILILGVSVLFTGCYTNNPPPADPIRADIDNNGSAELIYLEMNRSKTGNDSYYDWNLKVAKGYGEMQLAQPTIVLSFETEPENLRIEDYNNDGINDIVFLIIDRSRTGKDDYYDWHLMVALGTGSGKFSNPQIIATFERRPGS